MHEFCFSQFLKGQNRRRFRWGKNFIRFLNSFSPPFRSSIVYKYTSRYNYLRVAPLTRQMMM